MHCLEDGSRAFCGSALFRGGFWAHHPAPQHRAPSTASGPHLRQILPIAQIPQIPLTKTLVLFTTATDEHWLYAGSGECRFQVCLRTGASASFKHRIRHVPASPQSPANERPAYRHPRRAFLPFQSCRRHPHHHSPHRATAPHPGINIIAATDEHDRKMAQLGKRDETVPLRAQLFACIDLAPSDVRPSTTSAHSPAPYTRAARFTRRAPSATAESCCGTSRADFIEPPCLLRPISYVPESIAHLSMYRVDALRMCILGLARGVRAALPPPTTTAKTDGAQTEGPLVLQLPTEDDANGHAAETVVPLLEDGDAGHMVDIDVDAAREAC
ncbi:hypothetical protein DFH09DRAFT_1365004 [Mycena vulgaris]|nr:hypothetical protein DFH09DRAFT_1365004 [Mycena vulgaris]